MRFSNFAIEYLAKTKQFSKPFSPVHLDPRSKLVSKKNSQNLVALSLKPENSVVFRKGVIFGHRKVRLWVQRVFLFSIAAYIRYIFLPVVVKLVSETRKYATAKVRFKWLSAGNYSSMLYAHSSTFNMRTANTRIINNTLTLVCLHSCMDKNYWLCAYYSTSMLSATWCKKNTFLSSFIILIMSLLALSLSIPFADWNTCVDRCSRPFVHTAVVCNAWPKNCHEITIQASGIYEKFPHLTPVPQYFAG